MSSSRMPDPSTDTRYRFVSFVPAQSFPLNSLHVWTTKALSRERLVLLFYSNNSRRTNQDMAEDGKWRRFFFLLVKSTVLTKFPFFALCLFVGCQVGVTPELTEDPKCPKDPHCLDIIDHVCIPGFCCVRYLCFIQCSAELVN